MFSDMSYVKRTMWPQLSSFLRRDAPGLQENVADRRRSLPWGSNLSGRRSCKSLCCHLTSEVLCSSAVSLTAAYRTFVSGWCHYWEHAWYPLLILCGPRGGFMHDCSVHSCEKHLSVDATRSANSLRCKSGGFGCGSRFRFSLCFINVELCMWLREKVWWMEIEGSL